MNEAAPKITERAPSKHRRLVAAAMSGLVLFSLSKSAEDPSPRLAPDTVVASLGDSFTSGHNNGDVEGKYEDCFRHEVSYAHQIAKTLDIDRFTNAACSGATPEEVIEGRFGGPSQLDSIDEQTDYILLTTGANATNLSELLQTCIDSDCATDSPHVLNMLDYLNSEEFSERLKKVYRAIGDRAPNAGVIVVQYPRIIDTSAFCGTLVSQDIDSFAMNFIDSLNESIAGSVKAVKNEGYNVFLSPAAKGLDLCSTLGKSFHHDPASPRSIGHPTELGHATIARSVMVTLASAQYTMELQDTKSPASVGLEGE